MTVDEAIDVLEGSASGIGAAEAVETMRRYVEEVREVEEKLGRYSEKYLRPDAAQDLTTAREGLNDDR